MQPLTPTSGTAAAAAQQTQPSLAAPVDAEAPGAGRRSAWVWAALALITLAAALLRVLHLGRVPLDPFYDAAVRSMGLSWHNFFFGAFEPGGSVSIDKPPVDLWLQVASVKALGFTSTALKLPEALAGTVSVPLMFLALRRTWSAAAGLAAALALAVLPVEVITSRSDTMDAVMMAFTVLALLLVVRACETGRYRWLIAAAAALGVAFDVKLLESLVALPGLALFAYLGMPATRGRRLAALAAAGAVYVVVALAWLSATLLFPAHERPYAIGSTNGSAWNAAFVFNGSDRLGGKSPEPQTLYRRGYHYPTATQSERDHIPTLPPSPTRLLALVGPLSGERLGLELLIALLLGAPALFFTMREDRRTAERERRGEAALGALTQTRARLHRAAAGGLGLWLLTGVVLFSHMTRLHPRYSEGMVPAVAALLGIGVAWACSGSGRAQLTALALALLATVYYVARLLYGVSPVWWMTLAAALATFALALAARRARSSAAGRARPLEAATAALVLIAVLALPVAVDLRAIHENIGDAGNVGSLPPQEQRLVSTYVRARQGDAHYELAAESATQIGSLVVKDARPVLILTTYDARVLADIPTLKRAIARGEVKYAFLNAPCPRHSSSINPGCAAPVRWVRAHGTDVSRAAGLSRDGVLWLLPGARQ